MITGRQIKPKRRPCMRANTNTRFRFIAALFVCSAVIFLAASPAIALDEQKCARLVDKTIKLLKKTEILNLKGREMVKTLENYKDGIDKKEFKEMDKKLGPFDDGMKNLKKISDNIKEIKDVCD